MNREFLLVGGIGLAIAGLVVLSLVLRRPGTTSDVTLLSATLVPRQAPAAVVPDPNMHGAVPINAGPTGVVPAVVGDPFA